MDDLALLAERVERAALEEIHAIAPDELRRELGLRLETVDATLVSLSTVEASILINRAIGLGVEAPGSRAAVAAIAAMYEDAGVGRYYLHLHPDSRPTELRDWIMDTGLERGRGWMKFSRGAEPPPEVDTDLEIRRIGPEDAADFGFIVAQGFGMTEEAIPLLAALADSAKWHLYMSFAGGTPAGSAAMFVHEGTAWFDFASTLPEFRRRGAQGAALARRIGDALELGCDLMFTETGEAVEGDAQHSYRNIERFGFRAHCLRENFVPA